MGLFKAGLFPKIDVNQITAELNAKFDQLIAVLTGMQQTLNEILVELKAPKGG